MSYAILIREDDAGTCPVLVSTYDRLLTGRGVHWRFIAQTDDHGEAVRTVELLQERCSSASSVRSASPAPGRGDE